MKQVLKNSSEFLLKHYHFLVIGYHNVKVSA